MLLDGVYNVDYIMSTTAVESTPVVAAPVVAPAPVAAQTPGVDGEEFEGEEGLTLRALVSSKEAGEW